MRIAYFTAGTIGAGHVVRGLAIGRALARAGFSGTYTMLGPRSELGLASRADYRGVVLDHEELLDPARAPSSELGRALDSLSPDLLVVDMFWAPLVRLLPRRDCEAWLLIRRAPRAWLVGHPRMPFERGAYARVIGIEPGLDVGESIDPIVVAEPDDVRSAGALRDRLGVAAGSPLHVVAHAGAPDEWRTLLPMERDATSHVFTLGARRGTERNVSVHDGASFFPLATWLADADTIASGAGYNSFWEARYLGHAARTRFVSFERPIDDQAWRVRIGANHTPLSNGATTLAGEILGRTRTTSASHADDHWKLHARQWERIGPPLRPRAEDVAAIVAEAQAWKARRANADPRALVLGVTPELVAAPWPPRTSVTAVDRSDVMIRALWPASSLAGSATSVCADWRSTPFADGAFDVIAGDGCYSMLPFPREYRVLGAELRRLLADDGRVAMRVFVAPREREQLQAIEHDLWAGRIESFHVFKWRLLMALQASPEEGVKLDAAWAAWRAMCPSPAALAAKLGWSLDTIATIDVYRGASARYTFPTLDDLRAVLAESFTEIACHTPTYELGKRCPTLVLAPR